LQVSLGLFDTSPSAVAEAYFQQFQKDASVFSEVEIRGAHQWRQNDSCNVRKEDW